MRFRPVCLQVPCAQLSHNTIVSGSMDNTIKIWNLSTGKCLDTLFGHTGGMPREGVELEPMRPSDDNSRLREEY